MFPEYRSGVISGKFSLCADDFVSEFNRRAFETVIQLEGEDSYAFSVLGEFFNTSEISRLSTMELKRRSLTENGPKVFSESIEALKREKSIHEKRDSEDSISAIQRILAEKRNKMKQ